MDYLGGIVNIQHAFLWLCVFLCYFVYTFVKKPKYNLLPGPTGLPILGYLPFLGNNPHQELSKLGEKYGGIFSLYLGREYVVVVTDVVIIKQLLSKSSTSDRPPGLFQLMPNDVGLGETNGPEWVEQRRYTVMEMKNLGFGKSHWEELVQMEVSDVLELVMQAKGEPTDISNILSASISNNVLSLVSSQRLPMGHPGRDIIDHGVESFETLYNPSGIIVHYPKLFRLVVKLGILRLGRKLEDMINMNKFIKKEIEAIKQEGGGGSHSYINSYLNEIEKNKTLNLGNTFNEYNLIGNVQALVIAGSDTTFVSLQWLLLAMAAYPKVQEKLHQELDAVLGKNCSIRTNENVVINGYDIKKGTNIMAVLWAVHNDTRYWKDPDMFQPERFLTEDGKVMSEPEAYLPFSYGKRMCPGKTVALIELFQYFVSIMQTFHVLPASDTSEPDLEGYPGITFQPKRQPLRFVLR